MTSSWRLWRTSASRRQAPPGLVVQSDRNNTRLNETIIAAITSNTLRVHEPHQLLVDISTPDGAVSNLLHDSAIRCERLHTIPQSDVRRTIGRLSAAMMLKVDACLKVSLVCPEMYAYAHGCRHETVKTAVGGAINVLGMAKHCRARVLQASTSEVYGDPEIRGLPPAGDVSRECEPRRCRRFPVGRAANPSLAEWNEDCHTAAKHQRWCDSSRTGFRGFAAVICGRIGNPSYFQCNCGVNTLGPRACYDEGKRAAETLFMDYYRMHRVDIRIVRIFNTYGPRMHLFDGRVVSNFIRQALAGEDITIFGAGTRHVRSAIVTT